VLGCDTGETCSQEGVCTSTATCPPDGSGYNCDYYETYGYSCAVLESNYGYACNGCECASECCGVLAGVACARRAGPYSVLVLHDGRMRVWCAYVSTRMYVGVARHQPVSSVLPPQA
jgi:hypothetical protein